jgi:hypothetical protein
MAVDQDQNQIYGGNFYAGTMSIINGVDNTVINMVTPAGRLPTLDLNPVECVFANLKKRRQHTPLQTSLDELLRTYENYLV